MRDREPVTIENAEPGTLLTFAAISLFVGSILALLIVLATPMPA